MTTCTTAQEQQNEVIVASNDQATPGTLDLVPVSPFDALTESHQTERCSFHTPEDAAHAYAAAGLSVIPVKQDKSPAVSTWIEYKSSKPSGDTINDWYASGAPGVGIICGIVSGNLECLDIDEKYNLDSTSLLDRLTSLVDTQLSGLLPRLVHETSVNGGHHFVYRCKTIDGSKELARRVPTELELRDSPKLKSKVLIETRGEGAYFAAYPTPGYNLVSGSFTHIPEISELERSILLECARSLNQFTQEEKAVNGYPKKRNVSVVRPGDDFNLRGDISPVLREAGWQHVYSVGQTEYWRRPGKLDGISASFNNHPNMFYVFTSNADPLEPLTWYTKFALLSVLKYKGDFVAAAKDLAEKGYGETAVAAAESFLNRFYEFRFNKVTGRVEYKPKENQNFLRLGEYDLNSLYRKLSYAHIDIGIGNLASLLASDFAAPFDPFVEYYQSLPPWDQKTDYIAQLADSVQLKRPQERETWHEYLKKWLVAAVGCAIDPKVNNQTCLTLVGPQGYYKSTWLNRLLPDRLSGYLHMGTIDPTNKDTMIHLSECFLINLDELETLNKHELGSLKSIMTMNENRIRRPYAHFADQMIRRASFVGSINKNSFLADETGSRRFLVFEIETVNTAHGIDMNKVHAQAYYLFRAGFRYWFDRNETAAVNTRNREYSIQTTEDELVAQYCTPGPATGNTAEWYTATEVAEKIALQASYSLNKTSARDFGVALTKAGYPKRKLDGVTRYSVSITPSFNYHPTGIGVGSGARSGVGGPIFAENSSF